MFLKEGEMRGRALQATIKVSGFLAMILTWRGEEESRPATSLGGSARPFGPSWNQNEIENMANP